MKNRMISASFLCIAVLVLASSGCGYRKLREVNNIYALPVLAGEISHVSVVLQARLTSSDTLIYGDIHHPDSIRLADIGGKEGFARFIISEYSDFSELVLTAWQEATSESDFIVKVKVDNLKPGTQYFYRLEYGVNTRRTEFSQKQRFKTLPRHDEAAPVSFVMVTGSHLDRFYLGGGFGKPSGQGAEAYREADNYLGFPAFSAITALGPDFFIGNGDNVYYDHPPGYEARTLEEMRSKWHRQFYQPRFRELFVTIPTVWLKDDHDHRFDDSDTVHVHPVFGSEPSHQLGVSTFLEQVPLLAPNELDQPSYRTIRAGKLLELWLVEGRDYRSPNAMPDGPEKTLWGSEQKEWLKRTLAESDAVFKILVSPTPMVGPDDARKRDNHVNHDGFRTEGDEFFNWLIENDFRSRNFYIVCGDRHWKYHSVHPRGFHEFSCGAMVDQNSRIGRSPGDLASTDPEALIVQPYSDEIAAGGFLRVTVNPQGQSVEGHMIRFDFFDQYGNVLYTFTETAN